MTRTDPAARRRVPPRPVPPPAARPHPGPAGRRAPARARPVGRFRRFARRYGWRAYAIPVLTVATLVVLVDAAADQLSRAAPTSGTSAAGHPAASLATGAPSGRSAAPAPGTPAGSTTAEGEGGPTAGVPGEPGDPAAVVEHGTGSVSVVDGTSAVLGNGPLRRFVVEVEDGTDVDPAGFARAVQTTLGDPRSWGHGGDLSFQRVGAAAAAAGDYDFRVTLVSPGSLETYCPGVGTDGYTSCRYGERAVINLARWKTAVPDYGGDIATYRQYVVTTRSGTPWGTVTSSARARAGRLR